MLYAFHIHYLSSFTTRSARSIGACDNSCMPHGMPVPA